MHTNPIAPVNGTEETCPLQADAMPQWQAPGTNPPNRAKRPPSDPPKGLHPSVEAILTLRHERAMTQVEMANALGISQRTLQDWERGRRQPQGPGKALLERTADSLGRPRKI
jgi:DNA-binding transcriptional regulator YiaG